jgi:hypothetical protein
MHRRPHNRSFQYKVIYRCRLLAQESDMVTSIILVLSSSPLSSHSFYTLLSRCSRIMRMGCGLYVCWTWAMDRVPKSFLVAAKTRSYGYVLEQVDNVLVPANSSWRPKNMNGHLKWLSKRWYYVKIGPIRSDRKSIWNILRLGLRESLLLWSRMARTRTFFIMKVR